MTGDSSASLAAPDRAAGGTREETGRALLETPDACAALLRILADGRRHALDALTTAVGGSAERRGWLVAALDALAASGMPLARDGESVAARAFVPLDEATLRRSLPGFRVDVAATVDSTSSALVERVRATAGASGPMILASELQTAGRGRLGRRWTSAPGASLTVSFAFPIDRPLAALEGVTLVCGLAACDAIDAEGVAARLKWPNDLVVDDRKLGGILVEAHATGTASIVVIGMGLNVAERADDPSSGALPATDLARCGARRTDRNRLVTALAHALDRRLAHFAREGFATFVSEWNARDAYRDRPVVLRAHGGAADTAHTGIARGIDARGALLLDVDGRMIRILNGDLSLRPTAAR